MKGKTNLLIIGSGPFGLSLAAYVKRLGIDHLQVGRPMEFWKDNMPNGMFLRSASDWSLCPVDKASIVQYLESLGETPKGVEPLSRDFYLEYSQWFQEQHGLDFIQHYVTKLDQVNGGFEVTLDNGIVIKAKNVVIAIGMGYFKNMPQELTDLLPQGRYKHTVDAVRFDSLKGSRVLILGGRQSAYEWAALLNDLGVGEVHLVHRHESPKFENSDWEWVPPMVDGWSITPLGSET